MLVFNRFVVGDNAAAFVERAHAALAALGELTRSLDEPAAWCLVTEWVNVGAYRRALGAFEVKVTATPLLAEALFEPTAYETLASAPPGGDVEVHVSDRAV
jgi:hypothetical protein